MISRAEDRACGRRLDSQPRSCCCCNSDKQPHLIILPGSLSEIRTVYEKFQRRSKDNIAFLDKTLFCKIVPFTRTNALFIFENLSRSNSNYSRDPALHFGLPPSPRRSRDSAARYESCAKRLLRTHAHSKRGTSGNLNVLKQASVFDNAHSDSNPKLACEHNLNAELLSVYEFLCVLILAAYTHYINKIHCKNYLLSRIDIWLCLLLPRLNVRGSRTSALLWLNLAAFFRIFC